MNHTEEMFFVLFEIRCTLARRGESAETGVLRSGESGGVGEKGGGTGEMELLVLTDIISSPELLNWLSAARSSRS
jgi:hypothetical protein